jgi:U32 family peptidase
MPQSPPFLVKPEIMSPAGYWPQLHAAIEAGADSIYFGLKHFTARAKVGFELVELDEVMRTLHRRGVRGYVTFNSLVFEHEWEEAARTLAQIAEAGVDAIIVQDVGALKLARALVPELELHGSTQMSITDAAGVKLAQRWGVTRVTLARELSLHEIRQIQHETRCELEIFVHGALCVAYSGQCFSSEAWGGRSANRGLCAQACRLPYDLIVDGKQQPLGDARYLLSPGDLFALHQIPEVIEIGIAALKIEGRYKDADYVALTTRAYRQAVDDAWAGRPATVTPQEQLQLEQVYSRGFGPHFLTGINHQAVVQGRAPRHRGVLMGRVDRVLADAVWIASAEAQRIAPLKPGDGLVFDAADWRSPEEKEEGGRVYEVRERNGRIELRFGHRGIDFSRVRPGDWVWRTHDPGLDTAVRPYLASAAQLTKQPVSVKLIAREDEPLQMAWRLVKKPELAVTVTSEEPLAAARNRQVTAEAIRSQLDRLGNTAYELQQLEMDVQGSPFLPSFLLNRMRREAVAELERLQEVAPVHEIRDPIQTLPGYCREHPHQYLTGRNPHSCTCWCARRPNSTLPWNFVPPASPWAAWTSTD